MHAIVTAETKKAKNGIKTVWCYFTFPKREKHDAKYVDEYVERMP